MYNQIKLNLEKCDEIAQQLYRNVRGQTIVWKSKKQAKKSNSDEVAKTPEQDSVNRRESFRAPLKIEAVIYKYNGDGDDTEARVALRRMQALGNLDLASLYENAETMNISVSGIAFKAKKEYEVGMKCLLEIKRHSSSPPLKVCAEVVRSEKDDSGLNSIGLKFFGKTQNTDDELEEFVLSAQRQLILEKKSKQS